MKAPSQIARVDSKSFRCCLCCHVKTGTLIYGILVVLADIVFIGALVLATIRPDVLMPQKNLQPYDGIYVVETENGNTLETFDHQNVKDPITKENLCVLFGISLMYLISAIALIVGVAKNIASYLLPMFCLEVFEFCCSCLTFVSCFTYAPNIKQRLIEQGLNKYSFLDLTCLDSDYLMLLFVTVIILVLSFEAYILSMIWSCYKYIQIYVASRSTVREYEYDPDSQMLLPPRYEDAVKIPANIPEPPAYSRE